MSTHTSIGICPCTYLNRYLCKCLYKCLCSCLYSCAYARFIEQHEKAAVAHEHRVTDLSSQLEAAQRMLELLKDEHDRERFRQQAILDNSVLEHERERRRLQVSHCFLMTGASSSARCFGACRRRVLR